MTNSDRSDRVSMGESRPVVARLFVVDPAGRRGRSVTNRVVRKLVEEDDR